MAMIVVVDEFRKASPDTWVSIDQDRANLYGSSLYVMQFIVFGAAGGDDSLAGANAMRQLCATPGLLDVILDVLRAHARIGDSRNTDRW
jgi:hypothetical protein